MANNPFPAGHRATGRAGQEPRVDAEGSSADETASVERAYSVLAFAVNRCLVDQMLRSARRFGGDYERLVIWGVLAHLNVAPLMPGGSLPPSLLDPKGLIEGTSTRLRPVRVSELAQITAIPRETVRRKLAALQRQGWIHSTDAGWVLDVDRTDSELRAFTIESIERFRNTFRTIEITIADAAGHR